VSYKVHTVGEDNWTLVSGRQVDAADTDTNHELIRKQMKG